MYAGEKMDNEYNSPVMPLQWINEALSEGNNVRVVKGKIVITCRFWTHSLGLAYVWIP